MANYAIMRCKKLTGMGSVASTLQHCYMEREAPNADAERTPENYCSVSESTDQEMGRVRELLPEKRRKDALLAVEYVMTASPEWWKEAIPRQQAKNSACCRGMAGEEIREGSCCGTRSQVPISPEALESRVLRNGIFTKDVEDQAAIAKRISHAVNYGFAGTIAMDSQSAQNAKRARELQKTMDSQQKRLQSVTEPFKWLSR